MAKHLHSKRKLNFLTPPVTPRTAGPLSKSTPELKQFASSSQPVLNACTLPTAAITPTPTLASPAASIFDTEDHGNKVYDSDYSYPGDHRFDGLMREAEEMC